MATNINVELFKRYAPKKKLEIIEKLNPNELMNVSTATIERIVKEAGTNMYKSRNKRLYISRDRQRGNSWNSTIEAVELIRGKLYLDVYLQYSNTDCNTSELVTDFIRRGDFTGSVGKGLSGRKHWRVEKYRGKFGNGFKMITTSPYSTNFNHLTYFTPIA